MVLSPPVAEPAEIDSTIAAITLPIALPTAKPNTNDPREKRQTNKPPLRTNRTNKQWVADLCNSDDPVQQRHAHENLTSYLYVVAYNYLQRRANDIQRLDMYQHQEIEELARDFVQSFMEKLAKNDFALLDKFSGTGRFTSWAAQVTNNLIASELRKPYWQRQYMPNDGLRVAWVVDEENPTPHEAVEVEEIGETMQRLLLQLPDQQRTVLVRCVAGDEQAADVAAELGITTNALYIIAHRAKAKMRKLLNKEGIYAAELALFN